MASSSSNEFEEKYGRDGTHEGSPTLTHAPTVSDHGGEHEKQKDKEKQPQPTYLHSERPQYLDIPGEAHQHQGGLSRTESNREHATRLVDDLTLLQAERAVSQRESNELRRSTSRLRSAEPKPEDVFNQPDPQPTIVNLPTDSNSRVDSAISSLKQVPRFVRYLLYCIPATALLLIPILMGIYLPDSEQKAVGGEGGVQLFWFGIWLMVVWVSLWLARVVTSILPYVVKFIGKLIGSGNPKKWKDVGRQLELHAALFIWMLAVFISYHPILDSHKLPASGDEEYPYVKWIDVVYKVLTAFFILSVLNFAEKILIQWVAITFHQRTYSDRIALNKQSIA